MVLPPSLADEYHRRADYYSQTASKAEQIALCQFIRDGHLGAQTRRLKRLYSQKLKLLLHEVREVFGSSSQIQIGAELKKQARTRGLRLQILKEEPGFVTLLLSCSSMPEEDFAPACHLLSQIMSELSSPVPKA